MSVYFDILNAVRNRIQSVVSVPVVVRRVGTVLENDDVPLIVVSPGQGGEKIVSGNWEKSIVYQYPVSVSYFDHGDRTLTQGLQLYLDNRQTVRNQLYQPALDGASTVFDTDFDPDAAIEMAEYQGTTYDVTRWQILYSSQEQRV